MNPGPPTLHRLPTGLVDALVDGAEPWVVAPLLAGQRSKRLMLLRAVPEWARRRGHRHAELTTAAYQVLADLHRQHQPVVDRLLAYPSVGLWGRATVRALRAGDRAAARPGQLAALAVAAAVRTGTPLRLPVPTVPCRAFDGRAGIVLPAIGAVPARPGDRLVVVRPGARAPVVLGASGRWRQVATIPLPGGPADLRLSVDTTSWAGTGSTVLPAGAAGPPRRAGDMALGLDLAAAWRVLLSRHPAVAARFAALITVLAPLPSPRRGSTAMTLRDAHGCVFLSAQPDPVALALTLCHELAHGELAALDDLVPLTAPDDGRRFAVPWRADRRPLAGVLQGAYAHLAVVRFFDAERRHGPRTATRSAGDQHDRWLAATAGVLARLCTDPGLTPVGRRIVERMRTVVAV